MPISRSGKDKEPTIVELAAIVPPKVTEHKVPTLATLRQRQPNLPVVLGKSQDGRIRHHLGTPAVFGSDVIPHTPQTLKARIVADPPPIGSHAVEELTDAINQAVTWSRQTSERARQRALTLTRGQKPARRHREVWPRSWTGEEINAIRAYRQTHS